MNAGTQLMGALQPKQNNNQNDSDKLKHNARAHKFIRPGP